MKTCTNKNCSEINPQALSKFNKDKSRKDEHQNYCRVCTRKFTKDWMELNKGRVKTYRKGWNDEYRQESLLIERYRITLNDYNIMLVNQNYCCKICLKHRSQFKKALHVDHCHTTGKIRGLLCFKCNSVLGYFKDDINLFQNAINYLKR